MAAPVGARRRHSRTALRAPAGLRDGNGKDAGRARKACAAFGVRAVRMTDQLGTCQPPPSALPSAM
jgi:hypothetical protein